MSLAVVGAGFGRTGTMSLKLALEKLGVGPCYHMVEVFSHPEHVALWSAAADGSYAWDEIFADYRSGVDWPIAAFWKPLMERYPESKIILTHRDSEGWYESVCNTIWKFGQQPRPDAPPEVVAHLEMVRKVVWDGHFDGKVDDKDHAIAVYEKHNEEVKRTVPSDRLLVYQLSEGWGPLCDFLGYDVLDEPMPKANTTEEFIARFAS